MVSLLRSAAAAARSRREAARGPLFSFRSQVVLISGGSRGLGLALAEEAGRRGATVVIAARDRADLDAALEHLRGRGVQAEAEVCDVTVQTSASALVGRLVDRFGGIDVLINDAGTIAVGPFAEMLPPDFEDALAVNFFGTVRMMLATLPHMRARRSGRIVNVGSIGGRVGIPHLAPYCASKFALTGLCASIRGELRREGIVLTLVQPGLMRTGSPRNAMFKGRHRAEYAWFSLADSLFSLPADRAAAAILDAAERGAAEVPIGFLAQAGILMERIAPGLVDLANGVAAALLPRPGGIGHELARGFESESPLSPSLGTVPSEHAERAYNQIDAVSARPV